MVGNHGKLGPCPRPWRGGGTAHRITTVCLFSIIFLRAMHNRVYAMKNVYLLTHSNAEGNLCRPFLIVCQIIVAFFRPFVLDSKVVIQQRYVQMTCGELITSTIWRIDMNMNIGNPLISLQQPDFYWRPSLTTH